MFKLSILIFLFFLISNTIASSDTNEIQGKYIVIEKDEKCKLTCTYKLGTTIQFQQFEGNEKKMQILGATPYTEYSPNLSAEEPQINVSGDCEYSTFAESTSDEKVKVQVPSEDNLCSHDGFNFQCTKLGVQATGSQKHKVSFELGKDTLVTSKLMWYQTDLVKTKPTSGNTANIKCTVKMQKVFPDQDAVDYLGEKKITKSECNECKFQINKNLDIQYAVKNQQYIVKIKGNIQEIKDGGCIGLMKDENICYFKKLSAQKALLYACNNWKVNDNNGITVQKEDKSILKFQWNGGTTPMDCQLTSQKIEEKINGNKKPEDKSDISTTTSQGKSTTTTTDTNIIKQISSIKLIFELPFILLIILNSFLL